MRCGRNIFFSVVLLTSACSDIFLDNAEEQIPNRSSIRPASDLLELAKYAGNLSIVYRSAARQTTNLQDAQSFLIFLAAGAFVKGAVGSASDSTLANLAIGGAAVQQTGVRIAPKSAILGIYTGAKRLNCIAAVTRVGHYTIGVSGSPAASALAYGAIEEVRILTRESLVREIADYSALVTEFTPPSRAETAALKATDPQAIEKFSQALKKCLEKAPENDE